MFQEGLTEEGLYYSRKVKVPCPECDLNNQWKLSDIMRVVQQIGTDQLDALGITFEKMYGEGYVFLLSKEYLVLHRGIQAGEEVMVTTWPVVPKGAQFRRNAVMESAATGERLVSAYTSWLLADPRTHKILRPGSFPYPFRYAQVSDPIEEKLPSMRLTAPEQAGEETAVKVSYSNSDFNGHLNNAAYGDVVMDCLPQELWKGYRPTEFFVHYIKEARVGSQVAARMEKREDQWAFYGEVCPIEGERERCFEASLKLTETSLVESSLA